MNSSLMKIQTRAQLNWSLMTIYTTRRFCSLDEIEKLLKWTFGT